METTRRQFITSVGAAATGLTSNPVMAEKGSAESKLERPNILVIMTDQHSKFFLGCYGNKLVRTPNLDRLASEGMRFETAYCSAPLCVPSRTSFMTGRTPSENRVWNNQGILSSGVPTWAHTLATEGYETSLVGRMHFAGPDQRHGFTSRPIGEYSAKHPGSPYRRSSPEAKIYYHGGSGQSRSCVEKAGRGRTSYQHFDEVITEAACDYLRARASSPEQPFAATVGLVLPHCPFIAPKHLYNYYYDKVDLPLTGGDEPPTIRRFRRLRGILKPLPSERIRVARAAYYGMCEHVDMLIGRVLDCLEETGLAGNTLVIYCSDHGEMAGDHNCWWKSNYYEGSAGIPMMARLPGIVPAGAVCDAVCNLMDLGPTMSEIAGTEMLEVDGQSLWPTLQGHHPKDWSDETFSEFCDRVGDLYLPSRMIRSGKWKLWVYPDQEKLPPALFDLDKDPLEQNDLGQSPGMTDVREHLLAKVLAGWEPETVHKEGRQAVVDWDTLSRWAERTLPENPDALEIPLPSLEENVELL